MEVCQIRDANFQGLHIIQDVCICPSSSVHIWQFLTLHLIVPEVSSYRPIQPTRTQSIFPRTATPTRWLLGQPRFLNQVHTHWVGRPINTLRPRNLYPICNHEADRYQLPPTHHDHGYNCEWRWPRKRPNELICHVWQTADGSEVSCVLGKVASDACLSLPFHSSKSDPIASLKRGNLCWFLNSSMSMANGCPLLIESVMSRGRLWLRMRWAYGWRRRLHINRWTLAWWLLSLWILTNYHSNSYCYIYCCYIPSTVFHIWRRRGLMSFE